MKKPKFYTIVLHAEEVDKLRALLYMLKQDLVEDIRIDSATLEKNISNQINKQ